jgi:pyruvate carboxylase
MNGEVRQVTVDDNHAAVENKSRPKADSSDSSQVGAPMSGVVVEVRAKDGNDVQKGDPIAVLSAMKMVSSILHYKLHTVIVMLTKCPTGNGYLRPSLWQDWFARCQGGRLC